MPLMVDPDTGALFAQPLGVATTLNPGLGGALPYTATAQTTIQASLAAATNEVKTVASAQYIKQQQLSRMSLHESADDKGTCHSSCSWHASACGYSASSSPTTASSHAFSHLPRKSRRANHARKSWA